MRYDDASDTASTTSDTAPVARADHDSVPVGSMGPANGNVISGAGTETGLAGADTVGDASTKVVELRGAGGSADTGATLHVPGQYGALSMDPEGSYNYVRNAGTPDGVQDVFTYTLADSDNQRSSTTLTIEIDRTQTAEEKAAAAAQQLANAGDGVVTLPAGVNLSDIHVVGRDLVINMPDGTQMVIPGGAVFVPQLVIGDVEVPPTNVAALLIDAEPVPAAGTPQSSGGNFDVPVAPLDPGVPLGDLIPPTVLSYIPPEFEDVGQFIDRDPEIFIDPGDGNPVENAVDSVDESGLPVRAGETAGSSAASNDETTTGSIIYDSPDDPSEITIRDVHGNEIAAEEGAVIEGAHGWMSITAVAEGEITYSYTLADNADHSTSDTHDDFIVTITDNDGDTDVATLTINIVDDVPTARPDTDSIAAGAFGPATGNVLTDAAPGDAGDSDMNAADIPGADGAALTSITGFGATANGEGGFIVQGHYGVLTIDTNGDYSYTRNQNTPGGVTETFNYTITDGDGDTSSSTLTISIGDLPVTVGANATVLTDDDAIPAAGGNPGGVGDDVDAANLTGTLSGSGGDGTLSFSVLTSGAPAGFAYVSGGAGIVLVQQGGTTVLTVSVNSNGAYSVIQNAPIDHAEGVDENNTSFAITYSVTDLDGDSATGSLVINVDDDTPTINRAEVSLPGLVVDETDLAATASGDFSTVFNGSYGADGAGSTSYAVGVVNGADSGLTDVATGDPILLFNNGGVVEGRVGGADGAIAFTVAVNSGTGVVTLDQVRALDHPNMANPDDSVSPIPGSIQLTATITDSDGDPVSLSVNIGGQLSFEDDGPSVDITLSAAAEPTLVTQDSETDGNPTALDSATANFAASFSTVPTPGADGTGSLTVGYALGVSSQGVDSGLNQSGANIYLYQVGGVVIGSTSATQAGIAAGNTVFDVTANGSGQVTLTQYSQIDHPIAQDPSATGAPFVDQGISLADGLVTLTATATLTDGDGDAAMDSQALNIGANLVFQDDGPDISAVLTGTQIRIDETDGVVAAGGETDAPGGNLGTVTVNAASLFTVSNVNLSADTPTTLGYGLALSSSGVASGLLVSSTNAAIYLYDIGGVVTGSTSATQGGVTAGNTAFTLSINSGTGAVTMTQFLAVEHSNTGSNDEDSSGLAAGALSIVVTATDFDGDTDQASVDLGSIIRFEDDGPTIDVSVSTQVVEPTLITQDGETDGVPTAQDSASSTANFGGAFDLGYTTGSDGAAAPVLGYTLGVSSQGVDSGLNQGGVNIYLYTIGGSVVGSTSAAQAGVTAGNTVFGVSVNGSGVVTLTQYSQIDHPIADDPTATGAPFTDQGISLADAMVTLTASATITDNDGDSATDQATINIGANLVFQDDGPDISAVLTGAQIRIDETDGLTTGAEVDPLGGNLGTVTVNAASLFTVSNVNVSADAPTTLGYALALSSSGVASGLLVSSNNAPIYLYSIGGGVTGSTSATQGGVTAGNTAFTLSINSGTGAVTMTQFLAVEHSNTGSNDEDSSGLAAGALSIVVTATDFDGDTDQASVDLGSIIRFEDDGPSASADTDSIVGGNGPATGNVITGVDIVGGDANGTDGVADSIGSDSPGRITAVTSVNMPGNVDTDGSANFVIAGQYGTLTLNANGDYSYLRAGGPGGVSDVFTYTLTDADGDSVTTTLTIGIDDRFPTGGNVNVQLDDDAVVGAGGNAGGTGDDADATNTGGQLPGSGGDGTLTFSVSLTGAPAGFTYVSGGSGIVLVQQGGTTVLTVTVQPNGQYAVVQNAPIDHPDGLDENNVSFTVNYTVTDQDLDSAPGTITINVDDDTPTVDVSLAAVTEPTLITQDGETDGTPTAQDTASANFALMFNVAASDGADGPASPVVTYALGVSSQGVDSGLDQGGANIYLYNIGGSVVGSTSATQVGVTAGNTVFGVAVNATGTVTLTQYSQIDHLGGDPTPTGPGFTDHSVSLADGLVTLTASGTITDTDNDSATDSQVLNIGANLIFQDDGPDISAVLTGTAIRIDETDGVVAAGGETDVLGGNLGTVTVSAASLFTVSNVNVSADTPTTLAYALALSSNGVASGLLLSTSNAPIYLYNIGGVITGSTALTAGTVNAGNTAFTLSINSGTGAVTMTQFLAVEHSNPATPDEDSSGFTAGVLSVVVTATDYDGDTDQASVDLGSVIRFEDDAPSNFSPVDLTDDTNATVIAQDNALVNDGNANVTRLINDANNDGVGENFMGSDGFGSLAFTATGHTNGEALEDALGAALTSGGDAILVFGYGTGVLTATTDATNSDPNAVVFTATLAPNGGQGAASTYTLDFNQTIDNGAGFVLSDFSTAPAGQNKWIALDIDGNDIDVDNNDSPDLLITPTNLPGGTVNTSSTDLGNSNQWIDNGEGLRVDFVTDVRTGSGDEKVAGGYTFDGHYAVSGSSFQIMQTQGGGTASVRIAAYNDPDTGTLTTLSGSIVAIDPTSIVVTGDASYTIVDMGDGTFVITGLNAGANVAFDTNGVDYDAMAITSAAGLLNPATAAPADTFSGSPFAIGVFGYFTAAAGDPIDLNLGVTATDSDGDTSTGTIDITLVPDTSSSQAPLNTSKLQFSALLNDQQVLNKTGSAANSNTLLVGAIAATGLAVEPAAASGVADHGVSLVADTTAAKLAPSSPTLDSHDDVASSSAIVATSVSNDNARPENGNAHSSSDQAHESEGVAGQHNAESLAPTALSQGTEAPEQSAPAIVADSVAMPSAAAFQAPAADADVAGKHGGEVGRVISDALAGGGDHGAAIDAVLNALGAEGHGAPAANDALSSIANASVPAWDSGHFAAFTAGHGAAISEVMVAHMDAVQPAA